MCALSTERTIQVGEIVAEGSDAPYRRLESGPPEPRLQRCDLASFPNEYGERRSLLRVAQITDLHLTDAGSPGRLEFMERFYDSSEELQLLLPAHRPQEALNVHALEVLIQTINLTPDSDVTGAALQCVLNTGDSTDNCQVNELQSYLALMQGVYVWPMSGSAGYQGVQSTEWGDPEYWIPDSAGDRYKSRWGFPTYPDLLARATLPFQAEGCRLPWLACFGNHDAMMIGTLPATDEYNVLVTGPSKPALLSERTMTHLPELMGDPLALLTQTAADPTLFRDGPSKPVTPLAERHTFSRDDFVHSMSRAGGRPQGHGFSEIDRADEFASYVYDDFPLVRVIGLDTVNIQGHFNGSIGTSQLSWLEARLVEVHSRFYAADGSVEFTGNEDRLVVLTSHHGSEMLSNDFTPAAGGDSGDTDLPRLLGPELLTLLWRFPNVAVWLNGHVHRNRIQPRPDPQEKTGGFWEITTSSLVDWPCEGRIIEIIANGNDSISIMATMLSHDAPLNPADADGIEQLASLHRELAANDPHAGYTWGRQGNPEDRTVELLLAEPFPLHGKIQPQDRHDRSGILAAR